MRVRGQQGPTAERGFWLAASGGEREGGSEGVRASRRNDASRSSLKAPVPRAADGAGAFRGLLVVHRVLRAGPSECARARGLCRRGARRTWTALRVQRGSVESGTRRLTSGRRDGGRQRRVRSSARRASATSAQLFPRGVPLLRRTPGAGRWGNPCAEEHPSGGQSVHQVRRGPGGAALPGARGRGGPGVAPESLSPPLNRRAHLGHRSARGPLLARFYRAARTAPLASPLPQAGSSHGPIVAPLELTLNRGRNAPAFLPSIPTAGRSPRSPSCEGPQMLSWAGLGRASARRAGPRLGRAAPSAGPRQRIPAEVCRPFAFKSTHSRPGQRPGAPLPRRSQTNSFYVGCGLRENPIGSSP